VTHLLSPGGPDKHVDTAAYRTAHLAALRPPASLQVVRAAAECLHPVGRLDNAVAMTTPAINEPSRAEPSITQQGFPLGPQSHRATASMPQVVDVAR